MMMNFGTFKSNYVSKILNFIQYKNRHMTTNLLIRLVHMTTTGFKLNGLVLVSMQKNMGIELCMGEGETC